MPKSSKRFILSSDNLNSHGFRVLTSGIDLTNFIKNPIMYWLHAYPTAPYPDQQMPIGYWDDIQKTDSELSAVPVFDDNDEFAMKIYHKVEHGTLRAASVAIDPVELDANKANWVPGQKLPTFVKSTLGEASIVDRGSNADAVTLNLNSNNLYLKLSADMFAANDNNSGNAPAANDNNSGNAPAAKQPEPECSPEILAIIQNAVDAGKLTKAEADKMLLTATKDASVEGAIKKIIQTAPIKPENIRGKFHHRLIDDAANKSWDEISRTVKGGFNDMKQSAPELFKAKFFEKHGRLPAVI